MLQKDRKTHARHWVTFFALCCGLSTGLAFAAIPKEQKSALDLKEFFRPELYISSSNLALQDVMGQLPNQAAWQGFLLRNRASLSGGPNRMQVFIDPRSGAATNIMAAFPLIPGSGVGNAVTLAQVNGRLGLAERQVNARVVAGAVGQFLKSHANVLGIDLAQHTTDASGRPFAILPNGELIHELL